MRPDKTIMTVVGIVLVGVTYSNAQADMPKNRTIKYFMHEKPTDPETSIVFVVELDLEAAASDGDWVGWEVLETRFRQPHYVQGEQKNETVWFREFPPIDTPDGLWWIQHVAPSDPQLAEFVMPPLLEGTAAAADPGEKDLDYRFGGVEYVPPPGGPPYTVAMASDHWFQKDGEQTPLKEGEEEPAEVEEDEDPPGGT